MKRFVSILACISLLISLIGCAADDTAGNDAATVPTIAPTTAVTQPTPPIDEISPTTVLDTSYDITPHIVRDADRLTITSPSGNTAFALTVVDGQLSYSVTDDGRERVNDSPLGLTVDATAYGLIDSIETLGTVDAVLRTDIRHILGRTATANAPCVQAIIPVGDMTLELRVYDNGTAFRYLVDGSGKRTVNSEETAFSLPNNSTVWAGKTHKFYETVNEAFDPAIKPDATLGLPTTVCLADGGYVSLMEGDLSRYPGIQLEWTAPYRYDAAFLSGTYAVYDKVTTPWRIIGVADNLNALVNNTIIYQVCDAADSTLFGDDWVTPGRATWSWITDRSTDAVTPEVIGTYTDHAAALGFEYNIIDEGWINWNNYETVLADLAKDGDAYDVGQILWTGMTSGASYGGKIDSIDEAKDYLDYVASLGMSGAKIDFFVDERSLTMGVNVYEEILAYAAEKQLVINFHGCNKPTGQDVTFPNELNREAIFGFENMNLYNYLVQAQAFVTQPFVRNLAGHADFTPAAESAFHMAQLVLTDAPMQAIGSDPAVLLDLECVEMVKSVPTVWQETVVMPQSVIGESAVIARKGSNASWYVGGINYIGDHDSITLDLSLFLGEGTYRYELWTDDGVKFKVEDGTVTADDTLTVPFEALSGFIVRFDRVTLSQYGGAIDRPVTLSITDADTTVRYTLDGSEPTAASPLWDNGKALTFTESTTLTIKLMSGPDSGLCARYRFNLL